MKLKSPFVISLATIYHADNLLVGIEVETEEGRRVTGYGEAAPAAFVTGENTRGCTAFIEEMAPLLEGRDPLDLEDLWRILDQASTGQRAAKAAIDIAVHDALARALDLPLASLLGGSPRTFPTDMTVGLASPGDMAQAAQQRVEEGFSILKVKLGDSPSTDVQRMEEIRRRVGPDITLRVDANQGWSPPEALWVLERIAPLNIEVAEQPVRAGDIKGMAEVSRRSPIPIMADESLFSPVDALRLIDQGACHIFNIKLMKCGGLFRARQINAIAEAAYIPTFLGCMIESRVSIAAACHFVAAMTNVMGADLDAHLYLSEDPVRGGPYVDKGIVHFPEGAGSGVTPV